MRLRINFEAFGPEINMYWCGDLLFSTFSLKDRVTLTMNRAIRLNRTTMTAICDRIPALFRSRILGFERMQKSTLADELVLSEAERSFLSS